MEQPIEFGQRSKPCHETPSNERPKEMKSKKSSSPIIVSRKSIEKIVDIDFSPAEIPFINSMTLHAPQKQSAFGK